MGRGANTNVLYGRTQRSSSGLDPKTLESKADFAARVINRNCNGENPEADLADALANLHHWAAEVKADWNLGMVDSQKSFANDKQRYFLVQRQPYDLAEVREAQREPKPIDEDTGLSYRAFSIVAAVADGLLSAEAQEQLQDLLDCFRHYAQRFAMDWDTAVERGQRYFETDDQ